MHPLGDRTRRWPTCCRHRVDLLPFVEETLDPIGVSRLAKGSNREDSGFLRGSHPLPLSRVAGVPAAHGATTGIVQTVRLRKKNEPDTCRIRKWWPPAERCAWCGWLMTPKTGNWPNEWSSMKHSTTASESDGQLCSFALHV